MEEASEAVAAADAADAQLAALAAEYRKVRTNFQLRTVELQAQIEALAPDRDDSALQAVSSVELLNKYDFTSGRARATASARHRSLERSMRTAVRVTPASTRCYVETAQAGESVTVCEHCRRILVPVYK